jgi:hypothetical protein
MSTVVADPTFDEKPSDNAPASLPTRHPRVSGANSPNQTQPAVGSTSIDHKRTFNGTTRRAER